MGIVPKAAGNNLNLLIDSCGIWSRSFSTRKIFVVLKASKN